MPMVKNRIFFNIKISQVFTAFPIKVDIRVWGCYLDLSKCVTGSQFNEILRQHATIIYYIYFTRTFNYKILYVEWFNVLTANKAEREKEKIRLFYEF